MTGSQRGNSLGRVFVCKPLVEDVVCTVYDCHRLGGTWIRFSAGLGGEVARTAATVSELISLLRNKLATSPALEVPEQDQAMITVRSTLYHLRRVLSAITYL